ncbi:MAG: S8 family serine peptidase, partial [Acidobacteriota bacterium]
SITSPGTAKNVVTVGSTTQVDNALDPDESVVPNVVNNGIETISRFQNGRSSGQGPAARTMQSNNAVDWRIKPDVMAPGSEFANQRLPSPTTCLSGDNDQTGPVECRRQLEGAFAGSSFAAAAVSGAAADILSYFQQGFQPGGEKGSSSPQTLSGPELKAALIASADLMTGNPAWDRLDRQTRLNFYNPKHLFPFTPEQGYGRVQLDKLLPLSSLPGTPSFIRSESIMLPAPGSSAVRTFSVLDPGQAFRVAAAWYDPEAVPGDGALGKLIQDLDLTVTDCGPDGLCGGADVADDTTYNGNFFSEDRDFSGSLTHILTDFVCDNDPSKMCDPGAFDPANDCFMPPDPNCGGHDPSRCDHLGCIPTIVISEDCNNDGILDFSEFSLPVEGTACPAGARDRNNNNEAVFLSPAQLAQDRIFQVSLDYVSSAEMGAPAAATAGLVITGGAAYGVAPNSARLDKARYSCSDTLEISILDGARDGSSALLPAQVTLISRAADGAPVDTESGWAYSAAPGAEGTLFTSQRVAVLDAGQQTPSANNQIVSVAAGGTLEVTYADTVDPDGAGPLGLPAAATASAAVRCAPAMRILNIARRGTDAEFGLRGGCDPRPRVDPRAVAFGLLPGTGGAVTGDLFLDGNEDLIYSVAFRNEEPGDLLLDVTATLEVCALDPAHPLTAAEIMAGDCPGPSDPAHPPIVITTRNHGADPLKPPGKPGTRGTVKVGTVKTGQVQTASFPI